MKKNKKRSKESKNNFSRWKSIQRNEKKTPTMREGTMSEVEVEDEVEVVVMDEVGISTTTTPIMPKEKAQPEDEAETIQDRECRAPSTRIEERVNYAEEKNGEDGTLLLARNDTSGGQENTWYLNTGASNHMSGNKRMFVQLSESVNGSVAFGDDSKVPVKGRACHKDQSWTWHLRYGHLSFGGLELLSKKNMVKGLPYINQPDKLCEGCLLGKQFRKSFPNESISRAQKPLELIHTDVCDPFKPNSLGKSNYFLLFIDDFSRKTWVYFLEQKSEVFEAFKKFKAAVEKESGYQIKAKRSDQGGEFTSKKCLEFCEANGIRRPLTVPRSPQQNGVAERKNRTILDMARSMLKSKRLPKEFWAEAVAYTVYLSNRSPTRSVWGKMPQEDWSGRKPGYKLYNLNNEKIVISRDVVFDEEGEWDFGSGVDNFNFFPIEEDDHTQIKQVDEQQHAAPPISPASTTCGDSLLSFLNERTEERTRSLQDLYEVIRRSVSNGCIKQKEMRREKLKGTRIDKYFQEKGFTKCPYEHALYVKEKDGDILIVCLYVDDLVFTGSNPSLFEEFKRVMIKEFEMTDIGLTAYYLGIEVKQKEEDIFISQESYANEILKKFKMNDCKPISTPVECGVRLSKLDEGEDIDPTFFKILVGSLRYLTCTRPDIVYAVGLVS
ncbi:hypothetical protein KPL71_014344 [Citrus sinensis]|uniref:Uncharacterized protein n=1 Tax=Citrus sinensis TaxID=2711 RepID=A0ACB8KB26_CITSI|nr:hypothetical protein KPL71_014344 [Citrus sinensis]